MKKKPTIEYVNLSGEYVQSAHALRRLVFLTKVQIDTAGNLSAEVQLSLLQSFKKLSDNVDDYSAMADRFAAYILGGPTTEPETEKLHREVEDIRNATWSSVWAIDGQMQANNL